MEKFQIVLYGKKNTGKTFTLMKLVELLCSSTHAIIAGIGSFMWPSGSYKDARFFIDYHGHTILIGTAGDSWVTCSENCASIDLNFKPNLTIFKASAAGVIKLSASSKKRLSEPDICVCACRPNGDHYGAIKAIHSYSHKYIENFNFQFWLHKKPLIVVDKEENKGKIAAANLAMAEKIKKYIDDYIYGNL